MRGRHLHAVHKDGLPPAALLATDESALHHRCGRCLDRHLSIPVGEHDDDGTRHRVTVPQTTLQIGVLLLDDLTSLESSAASARDPCPTPSASTASSWPSSGRPMFPPKRDISLFCPSGRETPLNSTNVHEMALLTLRSGVRLVGLLTAACSGMDSTPPQGDVRVGEHSECVRLR